MPHPWHDVEIGDDAPREFQALVEIPKSSKVKYELDKDTGLLKVDRVLYSSVHYPANYGFIPRTLGDDGENDEKIICVPLEDPEYRSYESYDELPQHRLDELRSFFEDYKKLEDKEVNVEDFADAKEAMDAVKHAMKLYEEQFPERG